MTPRVSYATYILLLRIRHEAHAAAQAVYTRPHMRATGTESSRIGEFVTQLRRGLLTSILGNSAHEGHHEAERMVDPAYWLGPNIPVLPWTMEGPEKDGLPRLDAFEALITEAQRINAQADTLLAGMTILAQQLED